MARDANFKLTIMITGTVTASGCDCKLVPPAAVRLKVRGKWADPQARSRPGRSPDAVGTLVLTAGRGGPVARPLTGPIKISFFKKNERRM